MKIVGAITSPTRIWLRLIVFHTFVSVNTMTRRVRFPTLPKSALPNLIASSMTARESFTCYRDGDGYVIALDKTGFCVTE